MAVRDFALLVLICLVWASNNVISKIVVTDLAVPPIFYAALRFAIVAAVTLPWLLPAPRPLWRIVAVALLIGGCNFALLFTGLKTASPSAAAIVLQMGVPITTILSMIMLGEQVRWRRGIGIAMTLAGAMIVMWNPGGFAMTAGLLWILAATFAGSLGAVMMKQVDGVKPLRFQAWVGACSLPPLVVLTMLTEHGQWEAALAAGWQFWAFVIYSALVVSVLVHTAYYALIMKYEANLISPLTLMTPLATIALGILITKDHFDMRMAVGAALALLGVLIIALRRNTVMPVLLSLWNRSA